VRAARTDTNGFEIAWMSKDQQTAVLSPCSDDNDSVDQPCISWSFVAFPYSLAWQRADISRRSELDGRIGGSANESCIDCAAGDVAVAAARARRSTSRAPTKENDGIIVIQFQNPAVAVDADQNCCQATTIAANIAAVFVDVIIIISCCTDGGYCDSVDGGSKGRDVVSYEFVATVLQRLVGFVFSSCL